MKSVITLLLVLELLACSGKDEVIDLHFEKDLIPEGIAIDPKTKTVYLNSLKKDKIVRSKLNGNHPTEFISRKQHGYLSGFGMTIKGDTLFALGNSLPKKNNRSVLLLLQLNTGGVLASHSINDTTLIYLNDLAVSTKNDIYITDSESNKIYTLGAVNKAMEVFLESDGVAHSNGIAISDDDKYLYLASHRNGIRIVDIASKKILNKPNMDYGGIDGLKYYDKSLYGIVNSRSDTNKNGLYKFLLNESRNAIVKKEKIVAYGDHFKIPTTFDIFDGHIYYVIHSQLDNFNQETNEIIAPHRLEPYRLLKKKIE